MTLRDVIARGSLLIGGIFDSAAIARAGARLGGRIGQPAIVPKREYTNWPLLLSLGVVAWFIFKRRG